LVQRIHYHCSSILAKQTGMSCFAHKFASRGRNPNFPPAAICFGTFLLRSLGKLHVTFIHAAHRTRNCIALSTLVFEFIEQILIGFLQLKTLVCPKHSDQVLKHDKSPIWKRTTSCPVSFHSSLKIQPEWHFLLQFRKLA